MNELLEKNLRQLAEGHAKLSQALYDLPPASNHFGTTVTKTGDISFFENIGGKPRYLTSKFDPKHEAGLQVDKQWQDDAEFFVVFGIGGLYHVEEILKRINDKQNVFVVGSDKELFQTILMCRDLTHILSDPRLFLLIDDDVNIVYMFFRNIIERDLFNLPKVCIIEHPVECKWNQEFYGLCRKRFVDAYRQGLANVATRLSFGDQWVRNILANLPMILQSGKLEDLHNAFVGKPAILVSAGPSLNKNIDLLKEVRDRALIVCVDTAYRALYKKGIQPHLLVSIDGSDLNAKHFENIDYSDVPLVMEMSVHEDIVKNHNGIKIVLQSMNDLSPWLERIFGGVIKTITLPTGGSVATSAFSVIKYMGCDPVIFIGQDLSYPEGKAYANGTKFDELNTEKIEQQQKRELISVIDIYGNEVYTTNDYLIYLKWFEEQLRNKDRTYINATEGGALRNGVEILTLHEAIEKYCIETIPIQETIKKISQRDLDSNVIRKGYQKMKQTLAQLIRMERKLSQIVDKITEFLTAYEEKQFEQFEQILQQIRSNERQIEQYATALMFTDAISYRELFADIHMEETLQNKDSTTYDQDLEACKQSLVFTNRLRLASQRSIEMLGKYTQSYRELLCNLIEEKKMV